MIQKENRVGQTSTSKIVRASISAVSAMSLAAIGLVAVAAPAQAAGTTISLVCNYGGVPRILNSPSITGSVANDTVEVGSGGGLDDANVSLSGVTGLLTWSSSDTLLNRTYTITGSAPSYMTFTVTSGSCNGSSVTLSINGGSESGGSSSGMTSFSPVPITQQFGRPLTGTCDAAAPLTLNWGGVEGGGWSESWAQWMGAGLGGSVCTRTLTYSDGLARWVVAS